MNKENAIEWYSGDSTATLSLTQAKYINKVKKLAEKNNDVKIIENTDGSICAHVPLKFIKISAPRMVSDEQKEEMKKRLLKYQKSKKEE